MLTMGRPFRLAGVLFCALPAAAWADGPEAAAPAPPPRHEAAPSSERLVSPQVAAELATTIPKYVPPAAAADPAPADANVVRMPAYLVREPKLPTPAEVLSAKGLESIAMDRYLGPADGLDRGVLNHFTLIHLWQKIPVLGQINFVPFGSISNEARAMELYEQDRRLEEKLDLLDLAKLMKKTGDAAGAKELQKEVDDAFR